MKKYIIVMVLIALIIISVLGFNIMQIERKNTKVFSESGYILQSKTGAKVQEVERYYFNANENYKKQYNQKVVFKDTSGENISVEEDNFLHYTNGSIGTLTKSVILNLEKLNEDPIPYYTVTANRVLKKNGNIFTIKNLNQELEFRNFIWKISENKYLICGSPMTINFQNGETKEISGYIEVEYSDNEVVKLYNQELTYQTVSSNLFITLPDDIKINLSNKIVSQNNDNKMSLENMIIDSNANVEIIDIEDEKYKEQVENNLQENKEENESEENKLDENQTQKNLSNNTLSNTVSGNNENDYRTQEQTPIYNQNVTQQTQTISTEDSQNTSSVISVNENVSEEIEQMEEKQSGEETIIEEKVKFVAPTFKVEEFEIDSISMKAKIAIIDEENSIVDDPIVKILRNDTGKIVYQNEEISGAYTLDVSVSSLSPDVEYTMVIQASYKVEDAIYTKNFVYKVFRTKTAGIELEKDYCTNNELAFRCNVEEDTKVKSADVVLMDKHGEIIETKKIETESIKNIEFYGLNSNTDYIVELTNVLYDGQVITNGFQMKSVYKTLKEKPEISGTEFEIDKRNGIFLISAKNLVDVDGGIQNCRYEIYDTRIEGENIEPVLTINSNKNEQVTVPLDINNISRGVPYTFRLVADFYDNEKIVEFESEYSDIMKMDGVEFPTVRFVESTVTYERIEGTLIIEDINKTIDLSSDNSITVIYTDSVGMSESFTSSGSLSIPVSINGLRANETYKFSVYTKVNLQDGNEPIDKCYVGGAVVKTKIPQDLKAVYEEDVQDVKNTFTLNFRLQNAEGTEGTLEADTLSGMTFNIYAGQTAQGSPIRTLKVVDTDLNPYNSDLKQNYYDNSVTITPSFFNADNKDFRDKYYTITVTNAYDYTTYQNNIPIQRNSYTLETKGYRPDLPIDPNNAVEVFEIRNRDKDKRSELNDKTIVGYGVKAKYNNIDMYARKVIYRAYDANSKELIQTKEAQIGSDGVIPEIEFEVGDGTETNLKDTDILRRGNSYYFTYEMQIDLNGDGIAETPYPYPEEDIILRSREILPIKQEAKIELYPSASTNKTITYKYKISDVDKSLKNNQLIASIGNTIKDRKVITPLLQNDTYQEVTFENLSVGNISISTEQALNKNELAEVRQISQYYFEGQVTLNDLKYNVELSSNRVVITLLNAEEKKYRIGAVDVEFIGTSNTIIKEFLYPDDNIIVVNLEEIKELKDEEITVNVYAYYDTGLIGFDMESDYKLFQKAYKSGEDKYYCALNNNSNFVYTPFAKQNMYISSRTDNVLRLVSVANTSRNAVINLMKLEGGLAYEYDIINQKQVAKTKLNSDGNNTISFSVIIPGISMQDVTGKLNIVPELSEVKFKANITTVESTRVKDNKVYIEIYQTDENGNNEKFVRTEERLIGDFTDYITIGELEPKSYYFIKFKSEIITDLGDAQEEYLYDVDYQITGKNYYFSTLATVGISNISVTYNPVKYNKKSVDIKYKLDRIFGYQKIIYTIQKWNERSSEYETLFDNIEETLFKREMVRQISCNPGSRFEFDKKYKLIIKPLAEIEDDEGNIKELELGTTEEEFELQALSMPVIRITHKRPNTDDVQFKITVYDNDKVIENDEYSIRILNDRDEDITPEEYQNVKYKTDTLNNTIDLEQIEKTKKYKIEVITKVDLENSGHDLIDNIKSYTLVPINDSGISVGNITTKPNSVQSNKIDLIFTDSYKLREIDQIKYSIYDTEGYSINGTQQFIPVPNEISGEEIFSFTIDEGLQEEGRFYLELQFLKNEKIVDSYSLEYNYL